MAKNGGKRPTMCQERKLFYTEMVINEGLRLYSPPAIFRRVGKDFTSGKHKTYLMSLWPLEGYISFCSEDFFEIHILLLGLIIRTRFENVIRVNSEFSQATEKLFSA